MNLNIQKAWKLVTKLALSSGPKCTVVIFITVFSFWNLYLYKFNIYANTYVDFLIPGFGFLSFETEDAVERAVAEHFVNINGKQVLW